MDKGKKNEIFTGCNVIYMKQPNRWYFTADTNAKGYTYIQAYQTKWDPVAKTTKRSAKRYVGRLFDDGHVAPSKAFLESFPQYAGKTVFFGPDKTLVDEQTYRQAFPASPGPTPDPEEHASKDDTLNVGLTWAAETIAEESKVLESLVDVFGKEIARDLLHLAIYKLDTGSSMATFEDWCSGVYLKNSKLLTDQRISEILAKVSVQDFEKFFLNRHKAKLQEDRKLSYALDNTSISTYSETIEDAEFGYAKRDPHLKQINYTFVCDQEDGEIIFAHTYQGSISDVVALQEIIYRMRRAEFELENVTLVSDRGYSSLMNIQKMIDLEMKFVQGVRLTEDAIKSKFDTYHDSLRDVNFYDSETGVFARTTKEPWLQNISNGTLNRTVYVHLYRFPGVDEAEMASLVKKADQILKHKANSKEVPPELWQSYKRFVKQIKNANGEATWVRDNEAIKNAVKYAGTFVIRTNSIDDPFEALRVYRLRGTVEQDFNQFKNWVDGDRLRCTQSSYIGKLFVCTLATSLRLMMMNRAKHNSQDDTGLKIPNNSMDVLFGKIRMIKAEKRKDANAWVTKLASKKQRDMLTLLGLKMPPRVLR